MGRTPNPILVFSEYGTAIELGSVRETVGTCLVHACAKRLSKPTAGWSHVQTFPIKPTTAYVHFEFLISCKTIGGDYHRRAAKLPALLILMGVSIFLSRTAEL